MAENGMLFFIRCDEVKKLSADLHTLTKKALPYAVKQSLTATAHFARAEWARQIDKRMTLRNKWTTQNLRAEPATGVSTRTMQSKVGSLLPYQALQEKGGIEGGKGGKTKPIPTTSAAGQAMKTTRRTKLVQRKNWLSAIHVAQSVTGKRQRKNAVALRLAAKTGGVAYLDLGGRKGLFKVVKGSGRRLRIRMLWDLTKKNVHIRARPTLEPTLQVVYRRAPEIQRQALLEQFDRYHMHMGFHGPSRRTFLR